MYVTVRWKSVRCFEVSAKQLKQKAIIIEASSVTYTERVSMCGAEASREFISVGDCSVAHGPYTNKENRIDKC
ncbi:hypothetical protein NXW46_17930 [Bacteroides fragilis]|nr:hypothetical protein NXW46_17930 [Bacteroides fragilis]